MKELNKKMFSEGFLTAKPEHRGTEDKIVAEIERLLVKAIEKRLPDGRFGILFSGGLDSTLIAWVCKKLKKDFVCYTAALSEPGMEEAQDLVWAKKIAKELGLKHKIIEIGLKETEEYIKKLVEIIEEPNVVNIGVALPVYLSCLQAKKDKVDVIFSGLGSEEIFAGYERHKIAGDINEECLRGLLNMPRRDLDRDIALSNATGVEFRVPFLDTELVEYTLRIPAKYKIAKFKGKELSKVILRQAALSMGFKEEFAVRKKTAAQYGSKFDKAIMKIAKKHGLGKKEYLESLRPKHKLAALFSSGKDSTYAMYKMIKKGFDVACLLTIKSKNPSSYMFHTPAIDLSELQAKAMGLPILYGETKGEKEKELADLKALIKKAKDEFGIEGVVTGALYSNYQRERIEKICADLGLSVYSPLWHIDQEYEMRSLIKDGFNFILTAIACEGLDKTWLGKLITDADIDRLVALNNKIGINIAGEGGEFETLVLDCPLFKQKIKIDDSTVVEEDKHTAVMVVKKAKLVPK